MNKLWYIHATEYYSAIERNEVLIHATTWMNLKKHAEWKKPGTKGNILYDSIYMRYPE